MLDLPQILHFNAVLPPPGVSNRYPDNAHGVDDVSVISAPITFRSPPWVLN
ncbi:hypothetical protein K227x_58930 [Rubripirellula lacrimiformis]|uniref:Uncharacterized protein n=1 Tax=Rubripirellula lacrimiformis TaxID=1930273 RepID=A0A517NK13_9BACT|nr:hypothetical protein K227x_58930 [Rubripirellula lacrimiformis]